MSITYKVDLSRFLGPELIELHKDKIITTEELAGEAHRCFSDCIYGYLRHLREQQEQTRIVNCEVDVA